MLSTFMEDIGISAQQFQEACVEGKRYPASFEKVFYWVKRVLMLMTKCLCTSEHLRANLGGK